MKYRVSLLVALSLSLAACADRTHLRDGYGEANRQAMARQTVNQNAGSTSPGQGLDPQEATIVSRSYQRSLAPKDQQGNSSEPMLFVAPQKAKGFGDNMPPPSVPQEGR